jgi:VWFA-related protein
VADLGKDDFEVFDDGARQEIASVVLVHGGRVFNLLLPAVAGPPAPEGLILPSVTRADPTTGRVFVVLVDDLHFTATDTPLVRALLKKVAATLIHPGDLFAVFSTGPSSIEIPMTYDHARLTSAISTVSGHGMGYRDIMDSRDGAQGPQGLRHNAHVAFSTAYDLIGGLERVRDRRKAVILISNGYDFDPFPQGRAGADQVSGGRYGTPWVDPERGDRCLALGQQSNRFADADLSSELAALAGAANRVNAAVYAIDPRGLVNLTSVADQVDLTEMRSHIGKTQSSLRLLAEATGGLAVVNDNDFDGALKRIDAETSDYYILGYYMANADPKRLTRAVEVKVRRSGVDVRSRGWYRVKAQHPPSSPKR